MTDRELLENCLAAFDAIVTAPTSRDAILKKWGIPWIAYSGSHNRLNWLLAIHMASKLRQHLAANKPEVA